MNLSLVDLSLRKPVTVIMVALACVIMGVIAWQRLPLKFLPDIESPFLICTIPYPGSTPEQVVNEIAIPAEGIFRTIPGVQRLETYSDAQGFNATLMFEVDADMQAASNELRDRVERLKLSLPSEVDQVLLRRFNTSDLPIMVYGLFREGDLDDFTYLARKVLEPRLGRVDGIAQIQIRSPMAEREVLIEFDQDVLRSLHLDLPQLASTLQASSINTSAGKIQEGDRTCLVRTLGEFRSLEDIENIVATPQGMRLKDLATVRFGSREDRLHVALDGKPGLILMVRAEQEANKVAACQAVREEFERILKEPGFEGTEKVTFLDQSELITGAIENLQKAGLSGGLLAVLVLLLFLHRLRPTLIVALAIPTSMVAALIFMYFAGMSLNLVTVVSLIIAVGMLVDNSIVVVENIVRHRQLGLDARQSTVVGANEVGMAIAASTATSCVVFIPIIYMKAGVMSVFMSQLGVPMMVSLLGSLVVALTLIPLAMIHIRPASEQSVNRISALPGVSLLLRLAERMRPVQRTIDAYLAGMRLCLQWRAATVLFLLGFAAITVQLLSGGGLGMRQTPELDTREVRIEVELDQNVDMELAGKIFADITARFHAWRDELGIKNVLDFYEPGNGAVEAYLYNETEPRPEGVPFLPTEEVQRIVAERMPKRIPGAEIDCEMAHSGSMSGGTGALSVQIRGDDAVLLRQTADRLQKILEGLPSLQDARSTLRRRTAEIGIGIDDPLALRAGAAPLAIAQTVSAALRGARLPGLKYGGREINVWAQFREEDRRSKDNLDNVGILGTGGLVPLSQLVEYRKVPTPEAIQRLNGKSVITLEITAATENLSVLQRDIQRVMTQFELPPGYTMGTGRQLEEMEEDMNSFIAALAMSIVLVYLVMSAAFESFILPMSVLTTIPLSLAGAVWSLYATGTHFDTVTLIGCILMVGVIVNNGIVIVDHINHLRESGVERLDALVQAGRDRFRPVMMTALTTILGLIPLAIAQSGGAVAFAGLGRALVGGLTIGTLLTLVVVPLFYSLLDDLRLWSANLLHTLVNLGRKPASANAEQE